MQTGLGIDAEYQYSNNIPGCRSSSWGIMSWACKCSHLGCGPHTTHAGRVICEQRHTSFR